MLQHALKVQPFLGAAIRRIAVENQILHLARKFFERRIEIEAERDRGNLQRALQILRSRAGAEPAIEKRLRPIYDHARGIEFVFRAEAVTFGAGAVGRIEAERARLGQRHRNAAIRAGKFFGIDMLFAADDGDGDETVGELERCLDGFFEPIGDAVLQQQPIDYDFDRVILAAIERDGLVEAFQLAIHARANEAGLREFLEFLFVFTFAPAHYRRQHHDAIVGLERHHRLHYLLGGLPSDGLAALWDNAACRWRSK